MDKVVQQVRHWRDELINLSRRDRVLYYRATKSASLLIQEPSVGALVTVLQKPRQSWGFFFPPEPTDDSEEPDFGFYGGKRPEMEPQAPADDELVTQKQDPKSLGNSLRLLDRRTTQEFMDKGIWVLYLAAGFLEWVDPDEDRIVKSPILLIPVDLHRSSPKESYRLRLSEEEVVVNPALSVKMDSDFGLTLPPLDDSDELDVDAYLQAVNAAVRGRDWSVSYDAAIDIFSFYKEVMYKDLKENEKEICANDIVRALALGDSSDVDLYFEPTSEADLDKLFPAERMATIRNADASQRRSIVAAQQGHSFVMDGPPGTGKSQTISNIISQALYEGKSVLFVSEKIAALEVVKARLDEVGLGEYLLELHSHKSTRKEVAHNLYRGLTTYPQPPKGISRSSIDRLARRRKELSDYAAAMNESRHPLDKSLYEAIGRVAQLNHLRQAPLARLDDGELNVTAYNDILVTAGDLARAWGPVRQGNNFLWRGVDSSKASVGGKREASGRIQEARERLASLRFEADEVAEALELWWNESADQAAGLLEVVRLVQDARPVPASWLVSNSLKPVTDRSARLGDLSKQHSEATSRLSSDVGSTWRVLLPDRSAALEGARGQLDEIELDWPVGDDVSGEEVRSISEFSGSNVEATERVRGLTEELAAEFGLDPTSSTISRSEDLLVLAELTESSTKPESDWLDEVSLPKVREAADVLGSVVELYREKAKALVAIFKPTVLDLDLQGLKTRFDTVHRGFRKLANAYRVDKELLAEHTQIGKAKKATIAALDDVIEWKAIADQLDKAERSHADQIGAHYYQGLDSSFDSIASAIQVAEQATQLAAEVLTDRVRFKSQLTRGQGSNPHIRELAAELRPATESWIAANQDMFGLSYAAIAGTAYNDLAGRFRDAVRPLEVLAEIVSSVEHESGRSLLISEVHQITQDRLIVEDVETKLADAMEDDSVLLGSRYLGLNTDWGVFTADVEWAKALRTAAEAPLDEVTARRLLSSPVDPQPLEASTKVWVIARDSLAGLFVGDRPGEIAGDLDASYSDASDLLQLLDETMSDIDEWSDFLTARNALADQGLSDAVEFAIAQALSAEDLVPTIERATLEAWVDSALDIDERLAHSRSQDRDSFVKEFQQLDQQILDASAAKVMSAVNGRRPQTRLGPAGIIEREGQKKRRHMPVRDLIEKTKDIVQALKPCFMMSPLSVSQFLSPDVKFDLVIFDEASQVKPSDAVNCIYRGRQLVIAGDQKQLPPTNFFQRVSLDGGDEYEEDQIDEFESVLDLAKAGGMESLPLRWHYRSQHESLITYSNYSFYDGNLITFPGALESAPDVGVELYYVDGQYRRGGARDNPVEAGKVVDRVVFHARNHPSLTLGVVAFSEAQASTIEYFVDQKRRRHPELDSFFGEDRLSGFFVKNLENVQGDERDIMIFSIGYGPDEMGKITMNFGPLNKPGGERRLNVAITRARRRVEVVTSIRPEDFQSTSSVGPRHLQRYLDFAERGVSALALEVGDASHDAESPFEEEVIRVIRSWGFDVTPQVGVAGYRVDVGVSDPAAPGRYLLGVECDGAMYHSSKVARDRDRLRQEVLEGLGWTVYRIWGISWYQDRKREEDRLYDAIEAARSGRKRSTGPAQRKVRQEVELVELDLDAAPEWVIDYATCYPAVPTYREMSDPASIPAMAEAIEEVVAVEGPVAKEVVLQRLRESWGVGRAGHRIRDAFDTALGQATKSSVRKDRRHFLWLDDQTTVKVRRPSEESDTQRPIDKIPPEELRLAVLNLVRDAKRATSDELTAEAARLFGWARRGSGIAEGLDRAVRTLIRSKELMRDGQYLTVRDRG